MTSATFINLRINNAEQLKESISEPSPNTKLFLTYGKTTAWANDSSPTSANASISTIYEVWKNMIGGKRITGSDVAHIVPRHNWVANTIYTAYDHMNSDLYNVAHPFYVITEDYNVYKCISNNFNQPSSTEPTTILTDSVIETADGYVWKYMYTVSDSDILRFVTDDYIPVRVISGDDGSTQYAVQNNAIDGAIHSISIDTAGTGYTNASNITLTISGDGSGATATANINATAQTVNSVTITDPGSGYTHASVTVTDIGTGSGAVLRPIISPPGGHGLNALYELGAKDLMFNPRIDSDEENILPVTNDFRQIALLKDPYFRNSSNVSSNSAFLQAYSITSTGLGDFVEDEQLYQGASILSSTFRGRVVSWDSANGTALLINTSGSPAAGSLIGANSATVRFLTSTEEGLLQPLSGQILYVDNIKPIIRAEDQTEDFKIVFKF